MCDLKRVSKRKEITGWKIVLVNKEGEYFSAVMGFKYPMTGEIPIVTEQIQLAHDWSDILNEFYCDGMRGRTGIFLKERDANYVCHGLQNSIKYTHKVIKSTISEDIMFGICAIGGGEYKIAAGRRIKFLS